MKSLFPALYLKLFIQRPPEEVLLPKGILKICSNFIEITLWYACSPVHLLHIFTTPFCKYTYGGLLMYFFNAPGNLILLVLALERSNIFINKSMSSKDGVLKRHTLVANLCKCLPSLRQNLNINCIF